MHIQHPIVRYGVYIWLFAISFIASSQNDAVGNSNTTNQMKKETFYSFSAHSIAGKPISMSDYEGKVVLIVNTASKCGFTPQYKELEQLYKEYKDQGLVILGFPCNQFGGQEPGTESEIAESCQLNYGVSFPMFSKIEVNGDGTHPLFVFLKKKLGGFFGSKIKWNFTKFLVDRDGVPYKRYAPIKKPLSIRKDIEKLLAKKRGE